jgi:hypothetical protein
MCVSICRHPAAFFGCHSSIFLPSGSSSQANKHKLADRRLDVIGVGLEWTQDNERRGFRRAAAQERTAPFLDRNPKHIAIPSREILRIRRFEENTSGPGDTHHYSSPHRYAAL